MKRILLPLLLIILLFSLSTAVSETSHPGFQTISFGSYEQDNSPDNGQEPIEWLILSEENGRALLLSRYALDVIPFNADGSLAYYWEDCTLRRWLNTAFIEKAFSEEEQKCLIQTLVPNTIAHGHSQFTLHDRPDTVDTVFCLSYREVKAYIPDESQRLAFATPYAVSHGAASGSHAEWWIRSAADDTMRAATCNNQGTFYFGCFVNRQGTCIRPAMQVDMKAVQLLNINTMLDTLSVQELIELRSRIEERIDRLSKPQTQEKASIPDGHTIRELFPDVEFAKCIRDTLNKSSIDSPVTQKELDRVTRLTANSGDHYQIQSLEGISNLRYLKEISFITGGAWLAYGPQYRVFENKRQVFVGTELPDEIGSLTGLITLSIDSSNITHLPDSMRNLKNLQTLRISCSRLNELPDWIGELTSLNTLSLFKTFITKIPDSIGNLHHLTELVLTDTDITELPDAVCHLSNLKTLRLDYTQLTQLPADIDRLQLTILDISNTAIE